MERRCPCAASQIFSAEACIFCLKSPIFGHFIHLTTCRTFQPYFRAWLLAPEGASADKILTTLTKAAKVNAKYTTQMTVSERFATNYLRSARSKIIFCQQLPNLMCAAGKFFMQTGHKLLGQHINSCSRLIHTRFLA